MTPAPQSSELHPPVSFVDVPTGVSELYHANSALCPGDREQIAWIRAVTTAPEIRRIISSPAYPHGVGLHTFEPAKQPSDLEQLLRRRRSPASFGGGGVDARTLGEILYAANGVTAQRVDDDGSTWSLRSAPSGGGLYPIELWPIVFESDDLDPGLYAYDPLQHAVSLWRAADLRPDLETAAYLPAAVGSAAACIAMVAVFERSKFKYGERAYRFALLEAGHICQNILLRLTEAGLCGLPVGGFVDAAVNRVVGVDGVAEAVIYLILLGTPPSGGQAPV